MPQGLNMKSVKYSNYLAVLKTIMESGPMARVDLADATGLTKTTISNTVSDLIHLNLVKETRKGLASRNGGRRPILLESVSESLLAVGVDIRREKITAIVTDITLKPLSTYSVPIPLQSSKEEALRLLFSCIDKVMEGFHKKERIAGIGIGVIGPVDVESGSVVSCMPVPWRGFSLRDAVHSRYDLPVYVDVGSNMAAYGEVSVQPSLMRKTVVYVTLGSGVGAGLVLSGSVYQAGPVSGFGHTSIDLNGPECECGNKGCLENYVSTSAILERYRAMRQQEGASDPSSAYETVEQVLEAALGGETIARETLEQTASILGIALTGLTHLVGPDVIIIGGSVPRIGEAFAPLVGSVLMRRLKRVPRAGLSVIPARLEDKSIVLGAAAFCFGMLLESHATFEKVVFGIKG